MAFQNRTVTLTSGYTHTRIHIEHLAVIGKIELFTKEGIQHKTFVIARITPHIITRFIFGFEDRTRDKVIIIITQKALQSKVDTIIASFGIIHECFVEIQRPSQIDKRVAGTLFPWDIPQILIIGFGFETQFIGKHPVVTQHEIMCIAELQIFIHSYAPYFYHIDIQILGLRVFAIAETQTVFVRKFPSQSCPTFKREFFIQTKIVSAQSHICQKSR